MKALADAMAVAGRPLDDDEIISYISAGLGEEFDSLMASITVYNTPVTLTDFYAFLLSNEARQVLRHTQAPEYNSSANNVNRIGGSSGSSNNTRGGGSSGGNTSRPPIPQGGGQGGGYRGGRDGGRGRGRNNGGQRWRPKCQVCGKFGHIALKCRERFNHAYQADEIHGGYYTGNNFHVGYYSGNNGYHAGHGGHGIRWLHQTCYKTDANTVVSQSESCIL
jgi:histone deacetylase 1/2